MSASPLYNITTCHNFEPFCPFTVHIYNNERQKEATMLAGTLEKTRSRKGTQENAATDMNELQHDITLMQRIANKDEAALQSLYSDCGQRMYAYALRLTSDPALAEDVVQDALVAVWHSAKKYRGEGRLMAWLLGIVHHTALKILRRKPALSLSPEMENTLPAHGPLPEETVQANEQTRLVRSALKQLSAEHRAVLELVFYQGMSLNEAAAVCDCPVGTIKSRLNYARKHLRGLLSRTEEI
jgi:RNA polymerase sigma-70 factor, ECF subfamily